MIKANQSQEELKEVLSRVDLLERALDSLADCDHAADKDDLFCYMHHLYRELLEWHELPTLHQLLICYHVTGIAKHYAGLYVCGLLDDYERIKSTIRDSLELSYSRLIRYRDSLEHFLSEIEQLQD